MFYIDSDKCTGCGLCADVCPQGAISLRNNTAVIDQALCGQCGNCATICPAGAVQARAPVYAELGKGGDIMIGRGWFGWRGRGGGVGFGFRGASPPWPYVGRGRGGLPRCYYPGFYGGFQGPYPPQATAEQEVDFMKEEASAVRKHLEDLEARIKELEVK